MRMSLSIKKISGAFLALIASVALMFGMVSPASAAPTVVVGPGTGWATTVGALAPASCSITAVGRDSANRLVAISAGHCHRDPGSTSYPGTPGTPVYKTAGGQRIGELTDNHSYTAVPSPPSPNVDFQVILLDPNVVIPSAVSEDGTVTVHSFGTATPLANGLCKDGISTGFTCGLVLGQSSNSYSSYAFAFGGDSGGATVRQGTDVLIGMVIGGPTTGPYIYNKIQPVLNAINSSGKVGAGFTLVP
jgi:hypothetical protein